jgi:peptide/nickel transport system substrate-binding protein
VPDNAVAQAAVLSGQLDIVDGLSPLEIHQLQSRTEVRLDIHTTMDLYALLFQTRDPLLKDQRLRQAIAATIDVRGLARALTLGTSPPNRSAIPACSRFYDALQGSIPPANLELAKQLAKAAGYQGQTIRLATNHRYPQMFNMAVLVQAMARRAGINIEIETLDWASELARYNSGSYQALAFAYSARLDPSLSFEVLIGNKAAEPRKVWDSPEARALLSASRTTADPAERKVAFDQLQRLFLEQAPAVALFNSPRIAAVRSNVSGYQGWPAAQQRLWGVGKT